MRRIAVPPAAIRPLTEKYRPRTLDELLGQDHIVPSLRQLLQDGRKRSFLLSGDPGLGKTSLARIIVAYLRNGDEDSVSYDEIDGATYSGADSIRGITKSFDYWPFFARKIVVCIDEFQALSKQAMQCLLKPIEEPPSHGYYILCTTEVDKIPKTIRSRCAAYELKPVETHLLIALLEQVNNAEGLGMDWAAIRYLAGCADGSPRQALTYLEQFSYAHTVEEIKASLVRSTEQNR